MLDLQQYSFKLQKIATKIANENITDRNKVFELLKENNIFDETSELLKLLSDIFSKNQLSNLDDLNTLSMILYFISMMNLNIANFDSGGPNDVGGHLYINRP